MAWQTDPVVLVPPVAGPAACRLAAVALATVLAVSAGALAGCGARPVSPTECRPTSSVRAGSLLVLPAEPPESSIRGVLPGPTPPAAGRPYAVRWLVDARKAASDLRVQAAREGTEQVYRLTVPSGGVSGQLAEFPSDLVFPASGCWDADVFTGTAQGSLTFRVA
jgi:hypothetical protein